jgi:mitogen-activated protein kinase 15
MEYKEDSIALHIEKRFEKIEKIGSGAYGYVWKVKDRKTNKIYALKKVFLAFQNDVDAQRTFR